MEELNVQTSPYSSNKVETHELMNEMTLIPQTTQDIVTNAVLEPNHVTDSNDTLLPPFSFEQPRTILKGRALALKKRQNTVLEHAHTATPKEDAVIKRRRCILDDEDETVAPNSQTKSKKLIIQNLSDDEEDEPRVSIFENEDEIDGILEMNEALAQMTRKVVVDPLLDELEKDIEKVASDEPARNAIADPLQLFDSEVPLDDANLLYDSDGNLLDDADIEELEEGTVLPQELGDLSAERVLSHATHPCRILAKKKFLKRKRRLLD